MSRKKLQFVTLLFGSLLAMAIVCAQFFVVSHASAKTTAVDASASTEEEGASYFSVPSFAIPSSVHVKLDINPHVLFEILTEEHERETPQVDDVLPLRKFLVTLFRVIISPNAP